MYLYIFKELCHNETINHLLAFKNSNNIESYYFCANQFINLNMSPNEYILNTFFNIAYEIKGQNTDYLKNDIKTIWEELLSVDWGSLCRKNERLPFPDDSALGEDSEYDHTIKRILSLKDLESIYENAVSFYTKYTNASEAKYAAFKWRENQLIPIETPDDITFNDLAVLGNKKEILIDNTKSFLYGGKANDGLLVGNSGTGKSSCVKAILNMFKNDGLKVVEVSKENISQIPFLMDTLAKRKCRYILFIDDLSFEESETGYKTLKVILDGQMKKRPDNVLIYVTSNRRHLVRESWKDREYPDDIHLNDTQNEKMSLSERFGICLYFSMLSQDEYFEIVTLLLSKNGISFTDEIAKEAATWAIRGNGRSGRTALQFVRNYLSNTSNL